jgi:hypothetical protein
MDIDAAGDPRPSVAAERALDSEELRLLADQLTRMRGMLFGYSERFFERIRTWAVVSLALLVLASTPIAPAAIIAVPFLVPFAFLETGYLFFYTVFARRHAEYLERTINARLGRDVLVAHRLEEAYFYDPDVPKVAALSLGRPLGMMSAMTIGYTAGAALLWIAGMIGLADWVGQAQDGFFPPPWLVDVIVPGALAWTVIIAAYLVWSFLTGRDEARLLAQLDASYGPLPDASHD